MFQALTLGSWHTLRGIGILGGKQDRGDRAVFRQVGSTLPPIEPSAPQTAVAPVEKQPAMKQAASE